MDILERARLIRSQLDSLIVNISDEEALNTPQLFKDWSGESISYNVNDRVLYNDELYKVLQSHTSQTAWTPSNSPSLFAKILISTDGEVLDWVQPDSTNPYNQNDKVKHNDKTWISVIDGNVWEPGVYGWEEIG